MSGSGDGKGSFESEWRARFERFAARGGSEAKISGWSQHGLDRRLETISAAVDRWPPAAGERVLDLGCGTGVYCLHLREAGYRPVGADYSPGMLTRARAVAEAVEGLVPIRLAAADLMRLPFADAVFSGLVNVGVLQHVADAETPLREMARVLRPGAPAFLITLNRWSFHSAASLVAATLRAWRRGRFRPERHAVRRGARQLAATAKRAGFEVVRVQGVYLYPRGFRWLERMLQGMDGVRVPGGERPVLLPLANAYLLVVRKG